MNEVRQEPDSVATSSVSKLLQRSTLYHQLISDLGDIFDVSITGTQRSRAFQVVSDFVEQLEEGKYGNNK